MQYNGGHRNSRLARLFEIGLGRFVGWSERDCGVVFRHLLDSELLTELKPIGSRIRFLGLDAGSFCGSPLNTFADLLQHPSPPLPLLDMVKDFAKCADRRSDHPLPSDAATALYYLTIASALFRHRQRISTMENRELEEGLKWVCEQDWIENWLRQLASHAVIELSRCQL